MLRLNGVKNSDNVWVTNEISKNILKIAFLEDILCVSNNSSSLRTDHTDGD
jgi:hypothetical protein